MPITSRLLIITGIVFYTAINFIFLWICQLQITCECPKACPDLPSREEPSIQRTSIPPSLYTISHEKEAIPIVEAQPFSNEQRNSSHRLAVIVPFRDRWDELLQFVPHIHQFLNRQQIFHDILVINQADHHRFNRAMLINIGYMLSRSRSDYFVMHDVDLLPLNDNLSYAYPSDGPLHIASPELHPLYHYKKFVGGIMMMSNGDFEKINGLTNIFWGWGREDDEFYLRMMEAKLKLNRPQGIETGYKTFLHLHDKDKRPRDMVSIGSQRTVSRRRDKETGLKDLQYELVDTLNMTVSGATFMLVNVKLHCDYVKTPFCDHSKS